jgi:site-specific recombinase XerD
VSKSALVQNHEERISFLPTEQLIAEGPWTRSQRRLLEVLQHKEHRYASITKICRLAGYAGTSPWHRAMQDDRFAAAVQALGVKRSHDDLPSWQQRLLEVVQRPENRNESGAEICRLAGYKTHGPWRKAIEDERFVAKLEALGVNIKRYHHHLAPHIAVMPAINIEDELVKDVWDMRRLKQDYPKHVAPCTYEVDFSWIVNPALREQVKRYFRYRLARWKAGTFRRAICNLKYILTRLPADVHMGTLNRDHMEAALSEIAQLSRYQIARSMREMKSMVEYMSTSPAWTGPRPPHHLIWAEDIPARPEALPRPIPPDVLDQFDPLLEQAEKALKEGQEPSILASVFWDALLILRHTGMRFEDLAHLKAPDEHGKKGCLDQDAEGYWWIRIDHVNTKMGCEHRIPTRKADGVIDAIRRQQARAKQLPDHFDAHYLFRTEKGIISRMQIQSALKKLAPHLKHEEQPYLITAHQFRHSIATDMIEQGIDIYTVKEFLGHKSLSMTEKYVKVYLTSLKAKYDAYRIKKQQTYATEMMASQVQVTQPENDADGGWVENKVGKLYVSPLPDGIGNCVHLPMHDGCPDSPHCPTCPKLRASKRHLPVWENKARNLLITVEALRANPAYARARQKHEQELRHAEKVIATIKEEGFWDGRIHNSKTNTN